MKAKCGIKEDIFVPWFRDDLTKEEVDELYPILEQAFHMGYTKAYENMGYKVEPFESIWGKKPE